jgi:hypothetical protein
MPVEQSVLVPEQLLDPEEQQEPPEDQERRPQAAGVLPERLRDQVDEGVAQQGAHGEAHQEHGEPAREPLAQGHGREAGR